MSPIFDHTLLKLIQVAVSLFAGVLFLQSGFDKVIDFSGNKSYIQSVFARTFLSSVSTFLLILILILEVSAGIFSFLGGVYYSVEGQADFAVLGLELSALAILCLFTGQRIAKDYAGAASLASYFLLVVFGIYLFSLHG